MRVAIFGTHEGTQASFDPSAWDQVWRMAHDPMAATAGKTFEAHSEQIARRYGGPAYLDRLRGFDADHVLTTMWPYRGFLAPSRRPSWHNPQSSIGYMLCLAIEGLHNIGLFGVDMSADDEYGYQRPDTFYLIGYARAAGLSVHIDPASSLLKSQWTGGVYGHPANVNDMVYRLA